MITKTETDDEQYWPYVLIATKAISYDVQNIRDMLEGIMDTKATIEDVVAYVYELIHQDFSCPCGQNSDTLSVVLEDPDSGEQY